MKKEIKGIIFDFGDVICFWKTVELGEARSIALGLPKDTINRVIKDYLIASGDGTYDSMQDYFERAQPQAPIGVDIAIAAYEEMEASAFIDQRMIDLISSLKQNYKIGLLSNFPKGIEDYLTTRFKINNLFDAVVSSYNVKMRKPTPDVYHYAAQQLALKTEECLFIDDAEKNVLAARETGMQGIIFKSYADCKERLSLIL